MLNNVTSNRYPLNTSIKMLNWSTLRIEQAVMFWALVNVMKVRSVEGCINFLHSKTFPVLLSAGLWFTVEKQASWSLLLGGTSTIYPFLYRSGICCSEFENLKSGHR